MTLRIDSSEDKGTRSRRHLHRRSTTNRARTIAATAEEGQFLATDDPDTIIFRLKKGRLVQEAPELRDAAHPGLRQL